MSVDKVNFEEKLALCEPVSTLNTGNVGDELTTAELEGSDPGGCAS